MKSTNPYLDFFGVNTEEELENCFRQVNEEIIVDNEEYFTKDNQYTSEFYIKKVNYN